MPTHTVVALFDDYREAESAIRDLEMAGVPATDISLIANNAENRYGDYPEYGMDRIERRETADNGAGTGTGAGIGAVLGGAAGLLAGIGALAIPGVGPVVAAGALAATLAGAGVGAVVGGLVGALVEAGIPREHADIYAEAVRRGGTLVTARTDGVMRERVSEIFNRHAPADIEERAESWRRTGWTAFDERNAPYTGPAYPEAGGRASGGIAEPLPGVREPVSPAIAAGTAPIDHRAEPQSELSVPETGSASDLRRDWEVRRDEDRIREDAGRRSPVRVYPPIEERMDEKR